MSDADARCEVIAEAGVNHNGRGDLALDLVEAAAIAQADTVKFQTFDPDDLVTATASTATYQARAGAGEAQKAMLEALALPRPDLKRAARAAEAAGVGFLSTPFDVGSARFLVDEVGMRRIKVGSGELTNLPLLLDLARLGRPILLSTGMATIAEVRRALGVLAFARLAEASETPSLAAFEAALAAPEADAVLGETVVMQCTTQYPAPHDQANLRVLDAYAALGVRPGYSDHTLGLDIALAAVARGAVVIEKHLTLSRAMEGPDHAASLEPQEMAELVRGVRRVFETLGSAHKTPQPAEIANMAVARRVLVAARPIRAGEVFTPDNLTAKRAGEGLTPGLYWSLLGQAAAHDFAADEVIRP
ncbi:MAG: N-acetylneuraminate synthase family protein [Brevundimonas sp.]|uniref:N-acetylneuraminate synthase family protein n=1 Tax=Brevundimonas sp. TaxID=1871086 RepID=UPI0025C4C711|nr:N-acetylneuraminate synthase family protein [Brevundimonas sp.]MBX3478349.1 N-acetylneuraminate synthase family protein [Brevundimonas sp.]